MSFITENEKDELIGMMSLLYGDDFVQTIDRNAMTENTYFQLKMHLSHLFGVMRI
ncbi:hypothetical protein [Pseudomonas sp. RIT-PI-AD]|uniref:hypothetical protein n=1 Tax=Pseudomonas sp. RIT-PI-AD TaxID=3035294 RepID=UPI0021D7F452|nr:hypothetical protein [Pseudomonas sp. RIT-PI-AD]